MVRAVEGDGPESFGRNNVAAQGDKGAEVTDVLTTVERIDVGRLATGMPVKAGLEGPEGGVG